MGIEIDSTSAKTAVTNLTQLSAAANDAEEAATGNVSAWGKVGEEFEAVAKHTRAHILSLAGATEGTRAFTGILAHLPAPLLLAVAGIGGLTAAYASGAAEANAYAKAIATTGGAAGLSVGDLGALSQQIGSITGNTGKAAETLAALVATGAIGKESIGEFATATVEASEKVGISLQEIAKNFSDLATDPTQTTLQLGKALGYLTPALLAQIKALRQQGDYTDAARIAQKAYSDSLTSQAKQLSDYSSVWQRLSKAVGGYWDTLKNLGRVDLTKQLAYLQNKVLPFDSGDPLAKARDQAEIARLQKLIADQNSQAATNQAQSKFSDDTAHLRDLDLVSLDAYITKSKALYDGQTADIVRAYQLQASAIQAQDDVLEAQHSAGLLEDQQYYHAKIKLIQQSGAAQTAELDKQIAVAKKQAIDEAATRQQGIGNAPDDLTRIRLQAESDAADEASIQRIKDLQAQRQQIGTETSAKIQQTNIAEGTSVANLSRAYADLVVTSARYTQTLQDQYKLTLQGQGIGDVARSRASDIANLTQHFQDQLDSNTDNRRNNKITQDQYDLQNKIIEDSLNKSLQNYDHYYKDLQAKQGNWVNGAKEALANYVDAARNVANLADQAFSSAFQHMEDAIVNFATTGKFSFKDLATSILADLVRMEVKIIESQALQAILGSLFSIGAGAGHAGATSGVGELSGSTVGFAASGANANAGQPFIIGEKGPELFVPSQAGTIVPNGKWQGMGGGPVINQTFNFGSGTNVAQLQAAAEQIKEQTKAEVFDGIRRGQYRTAIRQGG